MPATSIHTAYHYVTRLHSPHFMHQVRYFCYGIEDVHAKETDVESALLALGSDTLCRNEVIIALSGGRAGRGVVARVLCVKEGWKLGG